MGHNSEARESIRGAILGALVGDAAGASLEFLGHAPTTDDVDRAMAMNGGGPLQTAPGQITDDGELALCLMRATAGQAVFDVERVAVEYRRWLHSGPFDIGGTTHTGLDGGHGRAPGTIHEGMWDAASAHNRGSKANGGLMRVSPLGAWGQRVSEEDLVQAACDESRLTHSSETCQHASAVYCLAIRHLVVNPGDAPGAFESAVRWANQLANPEIIEWLEAARTNRDVGYEPMIGFVKYGFTHAFRHLVLGTPYVDAIRETLAGGGDTDTNACIVGGMVGALQGERAIPEVMRRAIFECDTGVGRPRPEFLQTRVVLNGLLGRLTQGLDGRPTH